GHLNVQLSAEYGKFVLSVPTVEFGGEDGRGTAQTSVIDRQGGAARHSGVVKLVVRQQWAVVALRAVRLADEELQSRDLVLGENAVGRTMLRECLDILVETRWANLDAPLVGGDCLSDVDEHACHAVALRIAQRRPGVCGRSIRHRAG